MTLLLTEADVRSLLTMPIALEVVEESLRQQGNGELILHPRRRLKLPDNAMLHYMAAADPVRGYIGMKIYTSVRGAARFVVPLFRSTTGEMAALIEADALGPDSNRRSQRSGDEIPCQFECAKREHHWHGLPGAHATGSGRGRAPPGARARVWARSGAARAILPRDERANRRPVEPANSGEEAVRGADIVITATSATKIVLEGAWLAPGMHINAMGANWPQKRELDAAAVNRSDVVAVDSIEQAKMEAGDLIQAFGEDTSRWDTVRELSEIVAGKIPGRSNANQITLFKSNGIATWDLAAAVRVFELAVARGMGQSIPLWEDRQGLAFTYRRSHA